MKVRVFTDGACSNNGKIGAKASYACWFPEHKELSKAGRIPDDQQQTNQRGELTGIYEAIKIIQEKLPYEEIELQIFTDSMYSKNCLTQWVIGWQANNWKTSSGSPVSHRDIIEDAVKRLAKFKNYCISYVPAHTGKDDELSKHNEIVDKMAVAVLNPEVENLKIIHTNQEKPIEGLPIDMMGPPVSSRILTDWCRQNLEKLDSDELNNALLSVLTKTLKKNGLILEKQRLHKTNVYRLLANNLIAEKSNIIKEE
jgi:ribonuclease HI